MYTGGDGIFLIAGGGVKRFINAAIVGQRTGYLLALGCNYYFIGSYVTRPCRYTGGILIRLGNIVYRNR